MKRVNTVVGWVLGVSAVLFVAALSGFASGTLTDDPPEVTPYAVGTTATTAADGSSDATVAEPTGPGVLVVSEISFSEGGWVEIRNVGGTAVETGGHWLCNRPSYFALPDLTLEPGGSLLIASTSADGALDAEAATRSATVVDAQGSIGAIGDSGGEIGLYTSRSFSDASAIISYVEWGNSGHGRSGTAVEAGIWVADSFVESAGFTSLVAAVPVPVAPADWISGS